MTEIFGDHISSVEKRRNHSFWNITKVFKFDILIIRRNERKVIKAILPGLANTEQFPEKDIEICFIKSQIREKISDFTHLRGGSKELLDAYEQ